MPSASSVPAWAVAPLLLLVCGACSRHRTFIQPDGRLSDAGPVATAVPPEKRMEATWTDGAAMPTGYLFEAAPEFFPEDPRTYASESSSAWAADGFPEQAAERCRRLSWVGPKLQEGKCKLSADHKNYYSWLTARDLLLGVAAASPLANTSLDQDFQDWYQDDVRSSGTDDFSSFFKTFGEGQIFIPAFAGLAAVGAMYDDTWCGSLLGDFGGRTTRTYLVGAPPMLLMQYGLGASRPGETTAGSRWEPFDDTNAVSGHAFVGAVPFITAAKMTDNPYLKSGLYFCSTLTAWSRVNDDNHYLSQACLGWWMAYLACRAVDQTEYEDRHLAFTPVATPQMVGMEMTYRR